MKHILVARSAVLALAFLGAMAGTFANAKPKAQSVANRENDVFLLLGQSNMAGRGELNKTNRISSTGIFKLNRGGKWVEAVEPIHFDKKIAGAGLAASFARYVADKKEGAAIGLVPCALGGSALSEWMPGEKLYVQAIRRAKIAKRWGKIRAILWHQGESDADMGEKEAGYAANLAKVVASLRADLGLDEKTVPFIFGELSEMPGAPRTEANKSFNKKLVSVTNLVPNSYMVKAADLKTGKDLVHFNTQALRVLGLRYAEAYIYW